MTVMTVMSDGSSSSALSTVTRAELVAHLASGGDLDLQNRDDVGRTVAGSLLREVLINKDLSRHPRGLTVKHALIPDILDLSYCVLPVPLRLLEAEFEDVLALVGATITGKLDLTNTKLNGRNSDGSALVADRMRVDGDAVMHGLQVREGAVRLEGATITGKLDLTDTELSGQDTSGSALVADRMVVGRGAFMGGLQVEVGAVRLVGAKITGDLDLGRSELKGKNGSGYALVAQWLRVDGDAYLDDLHVIQGSVRLLGGIITGGLRLTGSTLNGMDLKGDALTAARLQVDGVTLLDQMTVNEDATLNLKNGQLGSLHINTNLGRCGWHRINFLGLRYTQLYGRDQDIDSPVTSARQGARLLANANGPRAAQPYWQLAEYYARIGNDPGARRIRFYSNLLQARAHPLSWPRLILYGLTTGFGYYPFLALLWLALLIGFDTAAVDSHRSDFIPTKPLTISASATGGQEPVNSASCDTRYPCFLPLLYATDTVVPVISLGQQDAWRIDAARAGTDLQLTLLATTAAGWVLTTLLVGGVGGLLRRS